MALYSVFDGSCHAASEIGCASTGVIEVASCVSKTEVPSLLEQCLRCLLVHARNLDDADDLQTLDEGLASMVLVLQSRRNLSVRSPAKSGQSTSIRPDGGGQWRAGPWAAPLLRCTQPAAALCCDQKPGYDETPAARTRGAQL